MKYVYQWVTGFPASLGSLDRLLVRSLFIVLFGLLTGVAAWVRIPLPFTPVPITLQTAVVLAAGVMLGRDGIYSQLFYLVLGGIGMPMFASGLPSMQALFGPTGGYLIGFVLASWIVSLWIHPYWSTLSYFERCYRLLLVSLVIFVPGVLQLSWFAGFSISKALTLGFAPFVVGDIVKVLAVAAISKKFVR